jgi:hypothetical protein
MYILVSLVSVAKDADELEKEGPNTRCKYFQVHIPSIRFPNRFKMITTPIEHAPRGTFFCREALEVNLLEDRTP